LLTSQPLTRLWESMRSHDSGLVFEFIALARHRKALREELIRVTDRSHALHAGGLSRVIEDYGLTPTFGSAENLAMLLASLSQALMFAAELGLAGHQGVQELIDAWLERVESGRSPPPNAN
jgi:uncharacterized membrane-anchored protein